MDVNNMKVTDLKKELKSRGLSIVGNKSELMARLAEALAENDEKNGHNNEDSVLEEDHNEEDLLADNELTDIALTKADDSLIDVLLDNNNQIKGQTQTSTKKLVTTTGAKRAANEDTTKAEAQTSESSADPNQSPNKLKTTNTIRLSVGDTQRAELRAQKFGDNKLTVRAQRFGLTSTADSAQTKTESKGKLDSSTIDEKLQKRAQRFGTTVSKTMKKIEDNQRLDKRKERFASSKTTVNTSADTTVSSTPNDNPKRKVISFSTKDDDRKQKRIARFGGAS